jgi:hypothetical protein
MSEPSNIIYTNIQCSHECRVTDHPMSRDNRHADEDLDLEEFHRASQLFNEHEEVEGIGESYLYLPSPSDTADIKFIS